MDEKAPTQIPDGELVAQAQQGDHAAFEKLVERHKHKAYRIAFDFTRDREEAKDLSQEAFLRAYTHLQGFDRRSGFYTWFYRIVVNLCLDHHRRNQKIQKEPFDDSVDHVHDHKERSDNLSPLDKEILARQIVAKVAAALDALPAKQRTVFILRNHQGLSIREIAAVMRAAEGTVKVHLHRAVIALRRSLAELA